ncbi:penicillin-binding protein 1A [Paenibacillus humicola]|uniref:penicillin-binding protein 1A n=1 Tax=Paenibacillus humicola TaxID=3110540 RepID=UPI00237A83D0|nr:penicillin-binding protein 1A [Paenibacillus humicola]
MDHEREDKPNGYSKWRTFGIVTLITLKWLFIFGFAALLFTGGIAAGYVASFVKDEPVRSRAEIEAKLDENAITGFAYFNDGKTQIGQLRTDEDRQLVQWKDIPQNVINAVLATEDNNFFEHIGIDFSSLARAVKQKLLNEETQTGGSTLTQQLARQVFLTLDKTDSRKAKEIFLALRLERFLTKEQIFTAYINKVQFGTGNTGYNLYGIKSAAKGIFGITDLKKLNIAQAAYLAGLPQRPTAYAAFTSKGQYNEQGIKFAIDRQHTVLMRMLETGRITQAEYDEAKKFDIRKSLAKPAEKAYDTYPYLMLETEREGAQILLQLQNPKLKPENITAQMMESAREQLQQGGYRVYTTIDKSVYDTMHKIGENPKNFTPDSKTKGLEQIAAVMIDHKTGAIIGMLEGRDFYKEQLNLATQMTRQPGSAMKPIAAYLPAIEKGLVQPGSILDDAPIVMKDGQKGFHIPMNWDLKFRGLVTAREALNESLNLPALKIFNQMVTIPEAWKFARKLGITTIQPQDEYAQTGVIGGLSKGVSVEELTNAYGAIADNGVFNDAYMISKITDSNGNVVYQHENKPTRVFSEQTAFLMTDMLRTVISDRSGTGHSIASQFDMYGKIPVVGKTGSTQNYGDVWFEGFTPDITLGVWSGYIKQADTLSKAGHARARSIWTLIMNQVTKSRPDLFPTRQFTMPSGIVKATVSSVSGKLPSDLDRQMGKLETDYFNQKYLPKEQDDALVKMKTIRYNGVNYIPQPSTPADMTSDQIVVKRQQPLDALMDQIADAQSKLPAKSRRPMSMFLPADAKLSAPSKTDPRVDDGNVPSPPSNIRLEALQGSFRVTFSPSPEKDVVGYRLYRSVNHGPYANAMAPVLTGDDSKFVNYVTAPGSYSYYVTAVDVGGHESVPSAVVSTDGSYIAQQVTPPGGTAVTPQDQDGGAANSGQGGTGTVSSGVPSSPSGVKLEKSDIGVKLTWNGNPGSQGVTAYNVYFSESGNKYRLLGSTAEARFEYISPLSKGSFYVTAVNQAGESPASAAVSISN